MHTNLRVVIFHGTGGSPNANWLPWLTSELQERGIEVSVPSFPTPEGQSLSNWRKAFAEQVGELSSDMILVGHSMGCGMILRLLEDAAVSVRASFLVAGWTGILNNPQFDPLIESFFTADFDWAAVRRGAGRTIMYHGDNDPYVPLRLGEELALKLQAGFSVIPGGGHLNAAAGFLQFEQLLADILEEIERSDDREDLQPQHLLVLQTQRGHRDVIGQTKPFRAARVLQAEVLKDLLAGVRLLVVGTGEGDELEALLKLAGIAEKSLEIVGCELSPNRAEVFINRFAEAAVKLGDLSSERVFRDLQKDPPFDFIQMSFVLHDQTEERKTALLAHCFALLRNGGSLLLADPMLRNCPNIPRFICTEEAKNEIEQEFREYYGTYCEEVAQADWIDDQRKQELLESLESGLHDALLHQDGRESFDTLNLYRQRLSEAGFTEIESREAYNKIWVTSCRKPVLADYGGH